MALLEAIMGMTAHKAARAGMSANAWIQEEREAGRKKSRSSMLAIFRNANQLETKKDRLKYVRKDRLPTPALLAESDWAWQTEYAYRVKVQSILSPGVPPEERFVTILSDNPLTPAEMESQVAEKWSSWEKYGQEKLVTIVPYSAIHRIA